MQPTPKLRLDSFSDGVFAIAITLLALELHVPHFFRTSVTGAFRELIPLIPSLLTFVLSFISIAIFWVNHHQLMHTLSKVGHRRILWGNMLFLLFVTLIPFATTMVSTNPLHPLAVIIYGLTLFLGSVAFSVLRYYVHQDAGEHKIPMRRSLAGPALYILALLGIAVSVWVAYALFLVPPLYYFLPKGRIKNLR